MPDNTEHALRPLLDYLKATRNVGVEWQGWRIARIGGGQNNLLYRATGEAGDFAVKFTIRDDRDRAGREHGALLALRRAGLSIAPEPVLLDRDRYAQPVVVQTWLEGEVSAAPPADDTAWMLLLRHLVQVKAVTPAKTGVSLSRAALTAVNADEGRALIRQQLARIPAEFQPTSLRALARRFEAAQLPHWPAPAITLCRADPSPPNFIRRPDTWASVDWENSGWGDPAFEVAELITHPAYMPVPPSRWDWVVETYCGLTGEALAAERIGVYRRVMLVWWAARLARYLYEVPLGGDQRLVARPDGWQADVQAKYEHYVRLAGELMSANLTA